MEGESFLIASNAAAFDGVMAYRIYGVLGLIGAASLYLKTLGGYSLGVRNRIISSPHRCVELSQMLLNPPSS